jgi:hypothetical protein
MTATAITTARTFRTPTICRSCPRTPDLGASAPSSAGRRQLVELVNLAVPLPCLNARSETVTSGSV